MSNTAEIFGLFPTPVMVRQYIGDLTLITNFLDLLPMVGEFSQSYGTNSQDIYILNHKICSSLKEFILISATNFAQQVLMYDYKEYVLSISWISHKKPGESHNQHVHPNSLISGVFYYGDFEETTSTLKFHKQIGGINASYLFGKLSKDYQKSQYSQDTFEFKCSPNTLILFPSYLTHSVPINQTNKVRKSLSFNIVPKGGLGDSKNLTELLFHKVI
jgi:uncharacterized protein (TIGR02466 family)